MLELPMSILSALCLAGLALVMYLTIRGLYCAWLFIEWLFNFDVEEE